MSRFHLWPVAPFRLDLTAWALRRRPENVVDRWDGERYRRALVVGERAVEVVVGQGGPPHRPQLSVELEGVPAEGSLVPPVRRAVERLLGLKADLSGFYRLAARDPRLAPLARRFEGVKPPRFPTLFEALVNAIACQQLSLTVGIRLLNRLAQACGRAVRLEGQTVHAFPLPAELAALPPETVRGLGFNRNKVRALLELAAFAAGNGPELERLERREDAEVVERLVALRGIGRWSAEYALLRGLGRLHVFPADDVGAQNHIARWFGLRTPPDSLRVRRAVAPWQPYAGFVYFHMLLERAV